MPHVPRCCWPVIIVVALCRVSEGSKPDISTDSEPLLKNEGDSLELTCKAFKKIYFIYPTDVESEFNTSQPDIEEEFDNGVYTYTFRRPRTVPGDTGWYNCTDEETAFHNPEYSATSTVKSVYVYVKSNTRLFVQDATSDGVRTLHTISGGTAVIPCRPTSPDLNITFTINGEIIELGDKVTYDPRIGFTIRNLTLKDGGYITCSIEQENEVHEVNYHLSVHRKQSLNVPKIIDDTLRHVTRGQTLHVNCTVDIDADIPYSFNWTTPQQESRITSRQYRSMFGVNTRRVTCELVIENVTDDDAGEYECYIETFQEKKVSRTNIVVYDPDIKYINLSSQHPDRHYERKFGDRIQWVVYVDSYPRATLRWINPKGEELMGTWMEPERAKFAINTTPFSTILRINRLDVSDMGIYSLQASNEDRIETLNFTLQVMSKPIPLLEGIASYYEPNKVAEMRCHVAAFPAPMINWSFVECPNYPSHENSTVIPLMNKTETSMMTSFLSTVKMLVRMSGHLNCTACNTLGCDSAIENVFVSDGKGGFGIIEPKELVAQGDDIELICAASVYNYTDSIVWLNEQGNILGDTDRLTIVKTKTRFTYRSILTIKNVTKADEKFYVCVGRTTDDSDEQMEYLLEVHDPIPPYITETNMNGSEISIDLSTQSQETIVFKCFVNGMPKPNITWLKNDEIYEKNGRNMFLHDNQELHIKYLLEHDSGKYSCRVQSRLGRREAYQIISIKGKVMLPKGFIALIAILVALVVGLVIYFTIKVRREKIMRRELMEAGLTHFENGALECLNPDLTVDDQAELLPYDKKWEFPRERLKLGKQLGSGAFGVVMKAEAQGICEDETVTTVAVKMVRRTTDPTYVRALASELKIMVHLGKHLNVVNLLGACTKNISKRELLVIVEYCRFGNLHNYLLRHRGDFINQIDPATGKLDHTIGMDLLTRTVSVGSSNRVKYAALSFSRSLSANSGIDTDTVHYSHGTDAQQSVSMSPDGCVLSNNSSQPGWRSNYRGDYKDQNLKPICTQDLLSWAFQVARGMEYLSQRRVLHGDLAARNILLAEDNIVKICDFGLAKSMYKDDNYKKKGDGPLPIKWMAIESIRDRVFSTQSDIWSFGIVLWEFFTLAETPYPGMEAEKQYQKLIEGYRMEQPEYATAEVYDIMLRCWKAKPTLRPSFTELVNDVGDLLEESVRTHYVSLNTPYLDMNTTFLEGGKNDYLTMMSAPDHTALSSPGHEYVNSPVSVDGAASYLCMSPASQKDEESGIFSPRPGPDKSRFEFPSVPTSDSEDALELSPMLKREDVDDPYLKPIDVNERRAQFARERQNLKNKAYERANERANDRDSGYCNAPRNLRAAELDRKDAEDDASQREPDARASKKKEFVPSIIRTTDNYVNMPKQKSDLRRDMPDGFSNPSYVMMGNRAN